MFTKNIFLITVLSLLTIYISAQDTYPYEYDGKNYEVVKVMKNYADAAEDAVSKGGHLIHVNDAGENSAMWVAITSGAAVPVDYTVVSDGGGIAYVWIGATDQSNEGTWLWDGDNDGEGDNFWNGEGNNGAGGGGAVGEAFHKWGGGNPPNEPDNYSNQDGAAIGLEGWPAGSGSFGSASQWNDIKTSNALYYVIEYENSAIDDKYGFDEINIYPNPFNDQIHIVNLDEISSEFEISIYDATGRIVFEETSRIFDEHQVKLNELQPGVYFLMITNSSQHVSIQKIQKL